ncbi:MAG: hypothetical protein AAGE52_37055 [Myxococcota bacterium]
MNEVSHPPQRKSPVRLLASSGWIEGTLHVPEKEPLIDFLNAERRFITLTDVTLDHGMELPFLALARSAIVLVEPSVEELVEGDARSSVRTRLRQVSCLFSGGMVMGTLALQEGARVSDELLSSGSFLLVGNCTVGTDAKAGKAPAMAAVPHVLLHAANIIGVAEV